jgi:hypothetical protein
VVKGNIFEEAIQDDTNKMLMGTRAYLVRVELSKRMPIWVSMIGLKVKLSHVEISKACLKCFYNHKSDTSCVKRKRQDFKAEHMPIAESNGSNNEASLDDWIEDTLRCSTGLTLDSTTVSAVSEPEGCGVGNFDVDVKNDESQKVEEYSNDEILLFLRQNELTVQETKRLESFACK